MCICRKGFGNRMVVVDTYCRQSGSNHDLFQAKFVTGYPWSIKTPEAVFYMEMLILTCLR